MFVSDAPITAVAPNQRRRTLPQIAEQAAKVPAVPVIVDAPEELATRLRDLRETDQEWRQEYTDQIAVPGKTVDRIIESLDSGAFEQFANVFGVAQSVQMVLLDLIVQRVTLVRDAGELLSDMIEPCKQAVADAEAALPKVEAEAAKKLTAAGAGLKDQPTYAKQPQVAERTFNIAVRQTTPVKEAAARLQAARSASEVIMRQLREYSEHQANAIALVREAAENAVQV